MTVKVIKDYISTALNRLVKEGEVFEAVGEERAELLIRSGVAEEVVLPKVRKTKRAKKA